MIELDPLLMVATRVLLPALRADEEIVLEFPAPVIALPLSVQLVTQLVSLGVTLKTVDVLLAAATR